MRLVVILIIFLGGVQITSLMNIDQSLRSFFDTPTETLKPNQRAEGNRGGEVSGLLAKDNSKTTEQTTKEISGLSDEIEGTKVTEHTHPEVDTNCSRFATMDHEAPNGLGHKLTEVVFGMDFAEATNSTYVYNYRVWSFPRGRHGSYKWLPEFLPLQNTEITIDYLDQLKQEREGWNNGTTFQRIEGQWDDVVEKSKRNNLCDVEFHTRLRYCCDDPLSRGTCYCTETEARIGSFERMKWRLRKALSQSNYTPPEELSDMLPNSVVSIVWHIRVGDIVLNARKEYFWNIATQIATTFKDSKVPPHIFFMGEGGRDAILKSFSFIPEMCDQLFNSSYSFPLIDARSTLYFMITSDVLVTSGSSFSAVAAMLRSSGIVLAAVPKEGIVGIYGVSENLEIDQDGTIPKIEVLEKLVESRSVT